MAEYCSIKTYVKNPHTGEIKESNLWNDLLQFTENDRSLAKLYYKLATNSDFIDTFKSELDFDENNQVTLASLQPLMESTAKDKKFSSTALYKRVRESFKKGGLSLDEAIESINSFNQKSAFKDKFLAVIKQGINGKCSVDVLINNKANRNSLKEFIKKVELRDSLIKTLKPLNVDVSFVENLSTLAEVERVMNTTKVLIKLCKDAPIEKQNRVLSHEIGRLVMNILTEDNPLIKRLLNSLNNDLLNSFLAANPSVTLNSNDVKGLAEYLIGQHLYNELSPEISKSVIGRLLDKIRNRIKLIFGNSDTKTELRLQIALERADDVASTIAFQYTRGSLYLDVENIIKAADDNSTNKRSRVYETLKETVSLRQTMIDEIYKSNKEVGKSLQDTLNGILKKFDGYDSLDVNDIKTVYNAAKILLSEIEREVNRVQDSLRLYEHDTFLHLKHDSEKASSRLYLNGIELKYVSQCTALLTDLFHTIDKWNEQFNVIDTLDFNNINIALRNINKKTLSSKELLHTQEINLVAAVLGDIYGSNYVPAVRKLSWEAENPNNPNGAKKFKVVEEKAKTFLEMINNKDLDEDITFMQYLLSSLGRISDIPSQVLAKLVNTTQAKADHDTIEDINKIIKLKEKYKFTKKELNELFERMDEGNKSGNLKSELHWGRYLKDEAEEKERLKKDAIKHIEKKCGVPINEVPFYIRNAMKNAYVEKHMKRWYEGVKRTELNDEGELVVVMKGGHAELTANGYIPNKDYKDSNGNSIYINDEYDLLTNEQKQFLKEYLDIKRSLDAKLPAGSTITVRAPQIESKHMSDVLFGSIKDKLKNAREYLLDKYFRTQNRDDIEFGTDITYNTKNDWYGTNYAKRRTKMSEVPFFFVRPLKNPDAIWIDLFGSLASYASMANSYSNLKHIASTVEIIQNVQSRRKLTERNNMVEKLINPVYTGVDLSYSGISLDDYYKSRVARASRDYIERQVYSKRAQKLSITKKRIIINKLLEKMGKISSFMFLGGNLHGASVNTATGFNEIWKEAFVDEDMNLKSCAEAHKKIIPYLALYAINSINKHVPNDKISAWFRYMNVRGDNDFQFKNMDMARKLAFNVYDLVMSPYTIGDVYMQGVSYLAAALNNKLYKADGTEVSMFDAYSQDEQGNLIIDSDTYFTSVDLAKDYERLKEIRQNLENPLNNILSQSDIDLLNKYGINHQADNIIDSIEKLFKQNIAGSWTDLDGKSTTTNYEIEYMNKCRELNDRMHGVYNKANKSVIYSSIWGQMIMSFKGYLLGYIERDFAPGRYDITLGRYVEGKYWTLAKTIGYNHQEYGIEGIGRNAITLILSLALPFMNVSKGNTWYHTHTALNDAQINNIKRCGIQTELILLLSLLSMLFKHLAEGDPDDKTDDSKFWWVMYYIVSRASFEQTAATLILGNLRLTAGSTNSDNSWITEMTRVSVVPVAISGMANLYDLARLGIDSALSSHEYDSTLQWEEYSERYRRSHYQRNINLTKDEFGDPKFESAFTRALFGEAAANDSKFYRQLIAVTPFLKSFKVGMHGKESYENWLFGTITRNK